MSSFFNDIAPYIRRLEEIIGLSFKVFILTAIVVTSMGIYVANLLFGNYSLSVLNELKEEKQHLQIEIKELKNENAKLHKQYLEWTDAK
jgi:ABC-type dipeptide/oligopeptide/nickel transport system permease component